ncbi:MAG: hypothetical protein IPG43_19425 [Proteobacteria bacterium]|nr:hypothetical protein [Pseudomonadota bacterium]
MNSALEPAVTASVDDDPLRACLHVITRLHGRPVSMSALLSGMPVAGDRFAPADFVRAAAFHGYSAQVVRRRLGEDFRVDSAHDPALQGRRRLRADRLARR